MMSWAPDLGQNKRTGIPGSGSGSGPRGQEARAPGEPPKASQWQLAYDLPYHHLIIMELFGRHIYTGRIGIRIGIFNAGILSKLGSAAMSAAVAYSAITSVYKLLAQQ
jgi:hypothetical protein